MLPTSPAPTAAPNQIDSLVDATPPERDRVVDLLRAGSIAVVVLWHWTFSLTHRTDAGALTMPNPIGDVRLLWLATWLLQVMPVFFLVGGYSNLAGWTAGRRDGRSAGAFLRGRLERLSRPTAALVAVWLVADVVLRATGITETSVLRWGIVVFVPLWFLGVYAAVVCLVPLTARLHERAGALTVVALGTAIALVDLGRFRFDLEQLGLLNAALVFTFCHQLGYLWRDGTLRRAGRQGAWSLVVGGLGALVLLTNLGVYPRSMVAVRGEAVSNMFPTTACIAALAVFQLGVILLVHDRAARWLEQRRVWTVVVMANAVAMTVFTWHMTALVGFVALYESTVGPLASDPTAGWWLARPLWIVGPGVALAALVKVFAPIEQRR